MRAKRNLLERMAASAAILLMAACSGEKPAAAPTSPAPKAASAPAGAAAAAPVQASASLGQLPPSPHRSKFTAGPGARDPFFPKKSASAGPSQVTAAPTDVVALLRAGFQGTIGSGADRLALVNNIILEAGRTAEVPLNAPGQKRVVTVKTLQVLPNSVTVEVQGQRVTLTRNQR